MGQLFVRRGVVVGAISPAADRADGRGVVAPDTDVIVGIHVRTHGHALVGAGELLQLSNRDAGGGQGVKAGAQVAGVALGEAALDLQERGEDDYHQHQRGHDGQRQHEGET